MTADEMLALARFQILDRRNCNEAALERLLGQMADEIERGQRALAETHDAWTAETTKRLQVELEKEAAVDDVERLQKTLRGIASCATCWACQAVAASALDVSPTTTEK